ncbi:MAG: integration host factor subunit beta [bacterium]|nr:integration host factor subunit beta [bacterium]
MNKSDLVEILSEKLKTLSKKEVDLIVDTVFNKMTESLGRGERIEIRGFGSFEVRTRDARQGRNPKSGEKVYVNTRRVPFFKVGKELKERINKAFLENQDVPDQQVASGE